MENRKQDQEDQAPENEILDQVVQKTALFVGYRPLGQLYSAFVKMTVETYYRDAPAAMLVLLIVGGVSVITSIHPAEIPARVTTCDKKTK